MERLNQALKRKFRPKRGSNDNVEPLATTSRVTPPPQKCLSSFAQSANKERLSEQLKQHGPVSKIKRSSGGEDWDKMVARQWDAMVDIEEEGCSISENESIGSYDSPAGDHFASSDHSLNISEAVSENEGRRRSEEGKAKKRGRRKRPRGLTHTSHSPDISEGSSEERRSDGNGGSEAVRRRKIKRGAVKRSKEICCDISEASSGVDEAIEVKRKLKRKSGATDGHSPNISEDSGEVCVRKKKEKTSDCLDISQDSSEEEDTECVRGDWKTRRGQSLRKDRMSGNPNISRKRKSFHPTRYSEISDGEAIEVVSSGGSADNIFKTPVKGSSMILTHSSSKSVRRRGRPLPMPHPCADLKLEELSDVAEILSPSSSPELEGEMGGWGAHGHLKTSDWVKQVHVDSMESNVAPAGEDGTSRPLGATPIGSAQKSRSRRRLVPGSMTDRLHKLLQRQKSEIRFWEHRASSVEEDREDISGCLTVHVLSFNNCCSLVMARCRVLQEVTPTDQEQERGGTCKEGGVVTIMFSPQCARFIGLSVGRHVRIHPPWQTVHLGCGDVILCPHFSISTGFSPLPSPTTNSAVVTTVAPPTIGQTLVVLSRSPAKALAPTRLFTDTRTPIFDLPSEDIGTHSTARHLPPPSPNIHVSDTAPSSLYLLDAITGSRVGMAGGFTATILRVFRKRGVAPPGMAWGTCQEGEEEGMCQALIKRAKLAGRSYQPMDWRWSLLVRDSLGHYAEIRMPPSNENKDIPSWHSLVTDGEDHQCYFLKLRVLRRLDPNRNPGLYSLISSLELAWPRSNFHQSTDNPTDNPTSAFSSSHARLVKGSEVQTPASKSRNSFPPLCYEMEWTDITHFQLFSGPCRNVGGVADEMDRAKDDHMYEVDERGEVAEGGGAIGESNTIERPQGVADVMGSSIGSVEGAAGDMGGASSVGEGEGGIDVEEIAGEDTVNFRVSLVTKIISFEPEIPSLAFNLPPSFLGGHYLTVCTLPHHDITAIGRELSLPHSYQEGKPDHNEGQKDSTVPDHRDQPSSEDWTMFNEEEELVIYLKCGFVADGLLRVLSCPGTIMLLRDILILSNKDTKDYFLDECSLIYPLCKSLIQQEALGLYPALSATGSEH